MTTAARIDELRKKFEENPRRYFAPLANELRKAGELSQAIALCREHLPKQPGHMSGYIVFGQALFESGELDEARAVFEQALSLDPENLIALRHLGDIARRQGEPALARRWYERVLDADPRNDDIAAQLATLATPSASMPAVAAPSPTTPPAAATSAPMPTPAYAVPPIMLGSLPTPDAAMRAVDIGAIALQPPEPPPLLDLDEIEAVGDDSVPPMPVDEPIASAQDAAAITADLTADLDADFEEGLAAPTWPDTSELVARLGTPRSVTPVSVPLPAEAVEAFGREPEDPMPAASAAQHAVEQVEQVLEVEQVGQVEQVAPAEPAVVVADDALDAGGAHLVSTLVDDAPDEVTELADSPVAQDEVLAADDAEFDNAQPVEHEEPADVAKDETVVTAAEPWLTDDDTDALPVLPATAVTESREWGASVDETAPESESLSAADELEEMVSSASDDDDLAWLAAPSVSPTPIEEMSAIAASMEFDARSSGEDDHVAVTEHVEPEPSAVEASFADVMPDEESDAPAMSDSAPDASPAFVTETMGELLMAQGLTDQAVAVYEELVRRRPYDPVLAARLVELREMQAPVWSAEAPAAVPDEPQGPSFTARERFAQLAARRAPRRTPALVAAVPESPGEASLSTLFGGTPLPQDDAAASALAAAFTAVPDDSASPGMSLFSATPAMGSVRQPTPVRPLTPLRSATPIATPAVADSGAFSFDRFFPDPATAAPVDPAQPSVGDDAPATAVPKAGDDLAQFSAWLKGLGNP